MPHFPSEYLDLSHAPKIVVFDESRPVWEALTQIGPALAAFSWESGADIDAGADVSGRANLGQRVRVGAGTRIAAGVTIAGPAWIGDNCELRSGAFLRENVIVGDGAVLGNSCEFKNCILFDGVEAPHFNYVGDSILGHRAHLGAGAILSNVRLDRKNVRVPESPGGAPSIDTGLRKFGAIVGDLAEIGCNSVISPGSLLGRRCVIYPGTQWRGALAADTVVKLVQEQVLVRKRTEIT